MRWPTSCATSGGGTDERAGSGSEELARLREHIDGNDRTSLLMFIKDQPGALYSVLEPFARNGFSMTRIESRPGHATRRQCAFSIDSDGHAQAPAMDRALAELGEFTQKVRVLGSCPAAIG